MQYAAAAPAQQLAAHPPQFPRFLHSKLLTSFAAHAMMVSHLCAARSIASGANAVEAGDEAEVDEEGLRSMLVALTQEDSARLAQPAGARSDGEWAVGKGSRLGGLLECHEETSYCTIPSLCGAALDGPKVFWAQVSNNLNPHNTTHLSTNHPTYLSPPTTPQHPPHTPPPPPHLSSQARLQTTDCPSC